MRAGGVFTKSLLLNSQLNLSKLLSDLMGHLFLFFDEHLMTTIINHNAVESPCGRSDRLRFGKYSE